MTQPTNQFKTLCRLVDKITQDRTQFDERISRLKDGHNVNPDLKERLYRALFLQFQDVNASFQGSQVEGATVTGKNPFNEFEDTTYTLYRISPSVLIREMPHPIYPHNRDFSLETYDDGGRLISKIHAFVAGAGIEIQDWQMATYDSDKAATIKVKSGLLGPDEISISIMEQGRLKEIKEVDFYNEELPDYQYTQLTDEGSTYLVVAYSENRLKAFEYRSGYPAEGCALVSNVGIVKENPEHPGHLGRTDWNWSAMVFELPDGTRYNLPKDEEGRLIWDRVKVTSCSKPIYLVNEDTDIEMTIGNGPKATFPKEIIPAEYQLSLFSAFE